MLFTPFITRGLTLRNRVGFSPMCTFRGRRGHATDWHAAHYAARGAGGAGLVIIEATAVEARGVISPDDLGLWSDDHVAGLAKIVRGVRAGGAAAGVQLAHAGRKAGAYVTGDDGRTAIDVVGPGPLAFDAGRPVPRPLDAGGRAVVRTAFVDAARRAVAAGVDLIELHLAHGYLLGSFLSPLTHRHAVASAGPSVAGRAAFPLSVIDDVRAAVPPAMPLWVRVSAVDPEPGGQTIDDTIAFARLAAAAGVDLVDCSAGGTTPRGWLKARPGYQVKFADAVRRGAGVPTAAVGVITDARQADAVVRNGHADVVLVGRAMRDDPAWAVRAAAALAPGPVRPRESGPDAAYHRPCD